MTEDEFCIFGDIVEGLDFNDKTTSLRVFRTRGESSFDVTEVSISNTSGNAPKKGDEIVVKLTVQNSGSGNGTTTVTPKLTSKRFEDFNDVLLPSVEISLNAGETKVIELKAGPFIYDDSTQKHYALGTSEYSINSIDIDGNDDTDFAGKNFTIGSSNAVLVPVLYEEEYFTKQNYSGTPISYVKSAFTRKVELFNNGDYTQFPDGMDQMMDIRQIFYPLSGLDLDRHSEGGLCEKGIAEGRRMLGLQQDWKGPDVGTQIENHGFDYLMCLTPSFQGGVACGWINIQLTGLFDSDLSLKRSQILVVHETGHILGAPHCDPLQTYVMCSGELHQKYKDEGTYVFYIDSRNKMSNRFD